MLVLGRNRDEYLVLTVAPSEETTEIRVGVVRGHCVRIGIDAPARVDILREELRDEKKVRACE